MDHFSEFQQPKLEFLPPTSMKSCDALPYLESQTQMAHLIYEIMNEKIAADVAYAQSLREIINKRNWENINSRNNRWGKYRHICNFLVENIHQQFTEIQKSIEQRQKQISSKLQKFMQQQIYPLESRIESLKFKKLQIELKTSQIEKQLQNYMQHYNAANKLFEDFIISAIRFRGFEKKNKFCKKAEQYFSEKVLPEKSQYDKKKAELKHLIQQYQQLNQSSLQETAECQKRLIQKYQYFTLAQQQITHKLFEPLHRNCEDKQSKFLTKMEAQEDPTMDIKESQFQIPTATDSYYLYSLFVYSSKPHERKLEDLMDFGQAQGSRDSLNSSVISSSIYSEGNIVDLLPENMGEYSSATLKQVSDDFKQIYFKEGKKTEHIARILKETQNRPKSRKLAIFCFEKLRQNQIDTEISPASLGNVMSLTSGLLTQCMEQSDIYNSKMLLLHIFSFYVTLGGQQISFHKLLKDHPIWANPEWWSCAFLQNCYQSLVATPKYSRHQDDMVNIWLIKGICWSNQSIGTNSDIRIFNLLDSITFRMKEMEINIDLIKEMANKFAQKLELRKLVNSNQDRPIVAFLAVNDLHRSQDSFAFFRNLFS